MHRLLLTLLLTAPIAAMAQYSNAPMLVVQAGGNNVPAPAPAVAAAAPAAPQVAQAGIYTPDFPEWAVTKAGENSSGGNPVPDAPSAPASAPVADTPAKAPEAPAAAAPAAPASPINKLWPIDTIPIFMRSCMGLHIELAAPCKCTIVNLMVAMPHDEFLRKSADGTIEQDPRLSAIRFKCLGTPQRTEE